MPMKRAFLAVAFAATASLASWSFLSSARAVGPDPSVIPVAWQLDFKSKAPERIIAAPDGETEQKTYWFIRYTVTNNTGQDILFTPEFELRTETGQIIASGKNVDNSIFLKIKQLYNAPFMESPFMILGKILQGEDNAKDGVAIFTKVDNDARVFRFFISGLCGETATVTDPITKKTVVLHKTLVLEYDIPGEAIGIDPQPQLKSKKWVMR